MTEFSWFVTAWNLIAIQHLWQRFHLDCDFKFLRTLNKGWELPPVLSKTWLFFLKACRFVEISAMKVDSPPFDSLHKNFPIKHRVRWSGSGLPLPDGSLLLDDCEGPEKKNAATHQRYVGCWVGWSLCLMEWRWNDSFFVFVFPQPLTKLGRNCRGYLVDSYIFSDGQLWWFILQLIFTRPRATNRGRLLRIRPANPTSRDFRGVFLLDTWVQNPSKNAGDASAANLFQSEKRKLFQTKRHHGQRIAWKLDNIIW